MAHQDDIQLHKNLGFLKEIFKKLIPDEVKDIKRHGNATLKSEWLAAVAIVCWGWTSPEDTLSKRFETACSVVGRIFGIETTATRQGLMKALASAGDELVNSIVAGFTRQLKEIKGVWSNGGKVNVAVDGSKFVAPRTLKNQLRFCASQPADTHEAAGKSVAKSSKSNKKNTKSKSKNSRCRKYKSQAGASKAASVQMLATVFWHIGTGLPLLWKIQGSTGSERIHAGQLVDQLPANSRLIGDAEYVGYPLWSTIINSRRCFLFRVGSNIRLLKNLGPMKFRDGYIYMWSESAIKKQHPPLVLRLFRIHNGKKTIYLVTNELEMSEATAFDLYRQRWGIEVFFRSVKQSCQKRKLICGSPDNVITELNWILLGIWAAMISGKKVLNQAGTKINRLSPIKVIRAFYRVVNHVYLSTCQTVALSTSLAAAVIADESKRKSDKTNRDYPRKKKHKECGAPDIQMATSRQKQLALKFNV